MATWDLNWDLNWDLTRDLSRDLPFKTAQNRSNVAQLAHDLPSGGFGVGCQLQVPRHLCAKGGGVALDRGEARIGARF